MQSSVNGVFIQIASKIRYARSLNTWISLIRQYFLLTDERSRVFKATKMVSDRGDKTHSVYKLTYVVDAITESPVCYISI